MSYLSDFRTLTLRLFQRDRQLFFMIKDVLLHQAWKAGNHREEIHYKKIGCIGSFRDTESQDDSENIVFTVNGHRKRRKVQPGQSDAEGSKSVTNNIAEAHGRYHYQKLHPIFLKILRNGKSSITCKGN
jgi:hypothetical protein